MYSTHHALRLTSRLLAAGLAIAACGGNDDVGDREPADPVTSEPGTATTVASSVTAPDGVVDPAPGSGVASPTGTPPIALTSTMTWQWQLQGDVNTSYDVDVYDIDLFDAPDDTIDRLRDDGRVVICYFSTAYEEWRADADRWPVAALGNALDDWEGERWVDIRDPDVRRVLADRLDLAVERGCHGVEPDNVTAYQNESGFDLTSADQLDFNRYLAGAAHRRGLLIGLKNGLEQIPDLVDSFDFAVNEQCVEYDECDVYAPFVDTGKAVFGAEYSVHAIDDPDGVCATARAAGLSTLILSVDLDDSLRIAC